MIYKNGQTSIVTRISLRDSTTGLPKTGLTFSSSGLIISTICDNESSATTYSAGASKTETITTLGTFAAPTATKCRFKEVDSTNHAGIYEIQIADARWATSNAKSMIVSVIADNVLTTDKEVQLAKIDPYDNVRMALTALPNTACTGNASLLTSGTGTDQLSVTTGRVDLGKALGTAVTLDANNVLNVSTKYIGGTTQTARDLGTSVLLSPGTGTGQISLTSGAVTVGTIASGASNIKKNVALTAFPFVMTDSTTHAPATGLTVTATRSLDGAAFAGCANAVTEVANGVYIITLATTDLNANTVTLRFTAAAADDRLITIITQP